MVAHVSTWLRSVAAQWQLGQKRKAEGYSIFKRTCTATISVFCQYPNSKWVAASNWVYAQDAYDVPWKGFWYELSMEFPWVLPKAGIQIGSRVSAWAWALIEDVQICPVNFVNCHAEVRYSIKLIMPHGWNLCHMCCVGTPGAGWSLTDFAGRHRTTATAAIVMATHRRHSRNLSVTSWWPWWSDPLKAWMLWIHSGKWMEEFLWNSVKPWQKSWRNHNFQQFPGEFPINPLIHPSSAGTATLRPCTHHRRAMEHMARRRQARPWMGRPWWWWLMGWCSAEKTMGWMSKVYGFYGTMILWASMSYKWRGFHIYASLLWGKMSWSAYLDPPSSKKIIW